MPQRHGTTRIGLLLSYDLTGVARDVSGSYLDVFSTMFDDLPVEFLRIPLHEGATPDSLDDADLWVIPGSPDSVFDPLPWITTAEEIIREAATTETPLFGICFGHQLVAQALGGRVDRATEGWSVGAVDYRTVAPPPAWPDVPERLTLLAVHRDQVVDVPDDAVVWSTSEHCPNAGLAVGERMWTVQGHPEYSPALCEALYVERRDRIGSDRADAAIASLARPLSNRLLASALLR